MLDFSFGSLFSAQPHARVSRSVLGRDEPRAGVGALHEERQDAAGGEPVGEPGPQAQALAHGGRAQERRQQHASRWRECLCDVSSGFR